MKLQPKAGPARPEPFPLRSARSPSPRRVAGAPPRPTPPALLRADRPTAAPRRGPAPAVEIEAKAALQAPGHPNRGPPAGNEPAPPRKRRGPSRATAARSYTSLYGATPWIACFPHVRLDELVWGSGAPRRGRRDRAADAAAQPLGGAIA